MAVEVIKFEADVTDIDGASFITDSEFRATRTQVEDYQMYGAHILMPRAALEENLKPDEEDELVPQVLMVAADPGDACLIYSLDHEVVDEMVLNKRLPELETPLIVFFSSIMVNFKLDPAMGKAGTLLVSNKADEYIASTSLLSSGFLFQA